MTTNNKPYEVWFVLLVDRPELRGPSYTPVAPGTRFGQTERFATCGQAVRFHDRLLAGEYDFASEIVVKSQVVSYQGRKGSPRTVRRQVTRTRTETASDRARALLGVASARRGNVLAFYAGWYCERVAAKYAGSSDTAPGELMAA